MTTTAIRTHHFIEKPIEVAGETVTAMVCEDCGTRMAEAEDGEECLGATLDEATDEVLSAPASRKGKRASRKVVEEAAQAMDASAAASAAEAEPADAIDEPVGSAEQLPPAAPRLPFPAPPFDAEAALERIFSKRHAVTAAKVTWEKKQAQAKEAKGEWETQATDLEDLIAKFEQDKHEAEDSVRPRLVRPAEAPTDGTLLCIFEKQAGERCPICRSGEEVLLPDSEEHRLAAERLFNENRSESVRLMNAAEKAGWNLTLETIERFTDEQRERLQAWIDHGGESPAILGQLCRALIAIEPQVPDFGVARTVILGGVASLELEQKAETAAKAEPEK